MTRGRQRDLLTNWQIQKYKEAHERLERALQQAIHGITKTQLCKKTSLSRSTIDRHLPYLKQKGKVVQLGSLLYWNTNYVVDRDRYKLIAEILSLQQKRDEEFDRKILEAQSILKGDELRQKLDEIYFDELSRRIRQFHELKLQGHKEAAAIEADLKKTFRTLLMFNKS